MPEPLHVVVMGVSASGKTTVGQRLAAELGWPYGEADDFHPRENVAKMEAGQALTDADRAPWLEAIAAWTGEHGAAGQSTVVTCSALKRAYRDVLRGGGRTYVIHLHADEDVLLDRISRRSGHFMPASLLRSQIDTLEPLQPDEPGIVIDVARPPADVLRATLDAVRRT